MALIPFILAMLHSLLFLQVNAQQTQTHSIKLGSVIYSTRQPSSWSSPSGLFAFGFYRHGNGFAVGVWLATQPENIIVWTANRDDPPVSSNATVKLTFDGKLLLRTEQGEQKTIVDVTERADSASMLETGNFVLYDNNSSVIWQSFKHPTDTLLAGQNLTSSEELVSSMSSLDHSSGRFSLKMQSDGNLVAYPVSSPQSPYDAYWSSGTNDGYLRELILDYGGQLCLTSSSGGSCSRISANSSYSIKGDIYRATLDADGILRL